MNEELNKALEQISDAHLNEAAGYRRKGFPWIKSIAAVLALVIACTAIWAAFRGPITGNNANPTHTLSQGHLKGPDDTPTYPAFPTSPSTEHDGISSTTPPFISPPDGFYPTDPPSVTNPSIGDLDIPTPPPVIDPPDIILPMSPLVGQPTYPQMVQCPGKDLDPFSFEYQQILDRWQIGLRQQYNQPRGYADNLNEFWSRSMAQFLSGEGNRIYSPANVYMALAMLAETTDGNSRQQILDLLGVGSIEALRTQAGHVWNAQYCDDGETTSLLANSLWLDSSYNFTESIIQRLSDNYYASVYNGNLGSEAMNTLLRDWINSQTGGLLKDHTDNLKMEPQTIFALCSTLYYTAGWDNSFDKARTVNATFHSTTGDVTAAFMKDTICDGTYYWGSNFGAVQLPLTKGSMWLILPSEGYTVEDILADGEYLSMALNPSSWKNQVSITIHLSLPKFDISNQSDLIAGLKNLGVTDVFTPGTADFTPMTTAYQPYVSQIDHAVRVAIDEDGAMAAAYTVIMVAPGSPPPPEEEMDFTLDRPFLFMVADDIPLFAGVVEQP